MTEKVSATEAMVETLTSQLEQRDRQLNSLTGQLAQAQSAEERHASAAETLGQRDRQLNKLTAQVAQLQSVNEQHAQSHEEAQGRTDELSAQLKQVDSVKREMGEQLRLEQEKSATASASIADRDQQILELRSNWEARENELQAQLNSQKSTLTELKAQLSHAAGARLQTQAQLSQLKSKMNHQKAQQQAEVAALKSAHGKELVTQQREAESSLQSLKIELKHYQRLLAESNQQRAQWKELANGSKSKQDSLQARLDQTQIQMERSADDHQQQLSSLEKAVEQATQLRTRERTELQAEIQSTKEAHAITVRELKSEMAKMRSAKTSRPRAEASSPIKPSKSKPKVAAKPKAAAKPKVAAKSKVTSSRKRKTLADELTMISGIGPVAAKKLKKLGVKTFAQIASWTAQDVQQVSQALAVGSRIKKEKWVQQAKKLTA